MSVILYQSGVTEMYEPKNNTFTDQEILHVFNDCDFIKTSRLYEIPNTWCVWGEYKKIDETNFNRLASDIIQEDVFSPILFIHDSQIDPAWLLTDQIILKGYDQFKYDILHFFDYIAENALKETQKIREEQGANNNLIFLITVGPTEDKRVLFEFDPHKQSPEFYKDGNFINFAEKISEFLINNFKNRKLFHIYEDKKTVIFIKNENVEFLNNKLIESFNKIEKYELSKELKDIGDKWKEYRNKSRKKKQN